MWSLLKPSGLLVVPLRDTMFEYNLWFCPFCHLGYTFLFSFFNPCFLSRPQRSNSVPVSTSPCLPTSLFKWLSLCCRAGVGGSKICCKVVAGVDCLVCAAAGSCSVALTARFHAKLCVSVGGSGPCGASECPGLVGGPPQALRSCCPLLAQVSEGRSRVQPTPPTPLTTFVVR